MDIGRKNGHKDPKRHQSSNELLEAVRNRTELGGYDLEDWSLLFILMHPRKLGLKNIEMTLHSFPSSIASDPSLHIGVLFRIRNKSASLFPNNHLVIKTFYRNSKLGGEKKKKVIGAPLFLCMDLEAYFQHVAYLQEATYKHTEAIGTTSEL
jgi:hypothetical protein